jgi:hypothetical protein
VNHPPAQNYFLKDSRAAQHGTAECGQLASNWLVSPWHLRTLQPGFSRKKISGTKKRQLPDSLV